MHHLGARVKSRLFMQLSKTHTFWKAFAVRRVLRYLANVICALVLGKIWWSIILIAVLPSTKWGWGLVRPTAYCLALKIF